MADKSQRSDLIEFVKRLLARNPDAAQSIAKRIRDKAGLETASLEETPPSPRDVIDLLTRSPIADLETIVSEERPVFFVERNGEAGLNFKDVSLIGVEAQTLFELSKQSRAVPEGLVDRIGRIDLVDFPGGAPFAGTGWLIDAGIIVTNRHVANVFARRQGQGFVFRQGAGGGTMSTVWDTGHFRDAASGGLRRQIAEVLYIEPDDGPNDIAFMRLASLGHGDELPPFKIAGSDAPENTAVFTLGYPAKAPPSRISDQALMERLYRGIYDVKRFAPGYITAPRAGAATHDCTTLGGNSGSVVVDFKTGEVVGLHFAGIYKETNLAVPASQLNFYVAKKRWTLPLVIESRPAIAQAPQPAPGGRGTVSVTVPVTITVDLGTISTVAGAARVGMSVEHAAEAFWKQKPEGVLAARVGYLEDDGRIGDTPCIAVSAQPGALEGLRADGPHSFQGYQVQYAPATVEEQLEGLMSLEAAAAPNAYDDDARRDPKYQLSPVEELMTVRAHVSPEYGFDELKAFMSEDVGSWVSAIYEFRASAISELMAKRLAAGTKIILAADFKTFADVDDETTEFDAEAIFQKWADRFGDGKFKRIAVPLGTTGLVQQSYHIKVTVRNDDKFWLSSGNWKSSSSQPIIDQSQRDRATEEDLPGNREWHVIVQSPTLAERFREHILQDVRRSHDLGGKEVPVKADDREPLVDVPESVFEAIERPRERRPPARLKKPLEVTESIVAAPLLTPDREGEVYSEAVLKLIRSARRSLVFQIPYIGMPSNPRQHRGYIDDLIGELTDKLVSLDDARVILRADSSKKFSDPTNSAWYFKSKGVDIDSRLKQIPNHHTKGMVVDGKRVLIGSHNWSGMGVSTNRDASLIFDHAGIAKYFADAFEIDWDRADPVPPKKFVPRPRGEESVLMVPPGDEASQRPGYRRMRLSDYLAMVDE